MAPKANASPSRGEVPDPNSSIITNEVSSACSRISRKLTICDEKVERLSIKD